MSRFLTPVGQEIVLTEHQSNYNSLFLDINQNELYVHFKENQLNPSPKGDSFDVNISWDGPIFNRRLSGYQVTFKVGNRETVVNETVSILNSFYLFSLNENGI